MFIYIYIERERQRERDRERENEREFFIYIYIYIDQNTEREQHIPLMAMAVGNPASMGLIGPCTTRWKRAIASPSRPTKPATCTPGHERARV